MPIARGTRLGRYDVESLLCQGGMGEVYQARDTRLNRIVAVVAIVAGLAGYVRAGTIILAQRDR